MKRITLTALLCAVTVTLAYSYSAHLPHDQRLPWDGRAPYDNRLPYDDKIDTGDPSLVFYLPGNGGGTSTPTASGVSGSQGTLTRACDIYHLNSSGVYEVASSGDAAYAVVDGKTYHQMADRSGNSVIQSLNMQNTTYWSTNNCSISQTNVPNGILGGTSCYAIIASAVQTGHFFSTSKIETGTTGTIVTLSFWVKDARSGDSCWISFYSDEKDKVNNNIATNNVYFDVVNKVVGSSTGVSDAWVSDITSNGFVRCNVTFSCQGVKIAPAFFITDGDGLNQFTGDGNPHSYWQQFQVWNTSVAHPPIPTSGSVVTTVKDELKFALNGLDTLFGGVSEQGTVIMKWRPGFANTDMTPTYQGLVAVRDNFDSLFAARNNGRFRSYDGSTVIYSLADVWSSGNQDYLAVLKFGYQTDGVVKFKVGGDSGSGVVYGTEANYDGGYTLNSWLNLFYDIYGVNYMGGLWIYNEIKDDDFIENKY